MAQFLGQATIRWDGNLIETNKGASLDLGGEKRNPIVTGRKVGFAVETVPAAIECETSLEVGMTLDTIRKMTGAVVTYECDTGQRYIIRDAFVTDTVTLKDGDGGNVAIKISGTAAEEVL